MRRDEIVGEHGLHFAAADHLGELGVLWRRCISAAMR